MSPDDRLAAGELPDLLSEFWAPLCAVGSHDGSGRPNAQICVSVFGASIVPERPRLLVILSRTTFTHDLVSRSGTLAVTLLAEEQLDLLEPLGLRSGRDGEKLSGLPHAATADGDPLFTGGVGYLACEVLSSSDLGDSTAYLVAVRERERLGPPGELRRPMRWAEARGLVGADFLERWARRSEREREAARGAMLWR